MDIRQTFNKVGGALLERVYCNEAVGLSFRFDNENGRNLLMTRKYGMCLENSKGENSYG